MTTPTAPPWTPSSDDVGNIVARLIPNAAGVVTGRFTADTIPTEWQVTAIAVGATAEVAASAPGLTPEQHLLARRVAAMLAGLQVADAYFPEAPADYVQRLRAQYEASLQLLIGAVEDADQGAGFEVFQLGARGRPELAV